MRFCYLFLILPIFTLSSASLLAEEVCHQESNLESSESHCHGSTEGAKTNNSEEECGMLCCHIAFIQFEEYIVYLNSKSIKYQNNFPNIELPLKSYLDSNFRPPIV
tara:strand:+ start:179 stop:496 length:318 start_codon:yes stop_codon:yes gene_type:complete